MRISVPGLRGDLVRFHNNWSTYTSTPHSESGFSVNPKVICGYVSGVHRKCTVIATKTLTLVEWALSIIRSTPCYLSIDLEIAVR